MGFGEFLSALTLITLPIGNQKDITLRALEALKVGKIFYAEDTRVFKKLLELLAISYSDKLIDSFHEHSEGKIETIIQKIKEGHEVYLVSDAGSPMISDPAYPLLRRVREAGIEIKTVPGVTSVITALELSGLPPQPFHFWGFVTRSKQERLTFFSELMNLAGTHIFFESPHRIFETIEAFFSTNPEGELVVTRELTKIYESVYRLRKENLNVLKTLVMDKGEFVVLFHVESKATSSVQNSELKSLVNDYLYEKPGTKKLAKIFAKILEVDSKVVYDQLIKSDK